MWIVCTLIFTSMVILNCIELSSQWNHASNDGPIRGSPRRGRSFPAHERTNSPSSRYMRPLSCRELGHRLEELLGFNRLTSNWNPNRIFDVRRCTFPADNPLYFVEENEYITEMPAEEKTVLTYGGDIFAIVKNRTVLDAIYANSNHTRSYMRVKINTVSGLITGMTQEEQRETPVTYHRPISLNFRAELVNHNLQRHE